MPNADQPAEELQKDVLAPAHDELFAAVVEAAFDLQQPSRQDSEQFGVPRLAHHCRGDAETVPSCANFTGANVML